MTFPAPEKNRTNLIAVVAIALLLVVGGVIAVVVATSGSSDHGSEDGSEDGSPRPTSTASSADTRLAAERDAALADGRAAVQTVNTLDHETAEEDLDRWASVATGELLDDLETNRGQYVSQAGAARSTTTATVLDAALTDLDEKAGTARLIAALAVDVTIAGQEPTTKRIRVAADLERTDDGWKMSQVSTL